MMRCIITLLVSLTLAGAAAVASGTPTPNNLKPDTSHETADRAVTGDVTVVSVPWAFKDGKIDWLFNPTKLKGPVNHEWVWQLNRMNFWPEMGEAYRVTRDEKYARAFAAQLESWLDQTGGAPPEKNYSPWAIDSPWRTIEEGIRLMTTWPEAWDAFKDSPAFTADLKRRFIASMHAQATNLLKHKTHHNWLLMEMNGVYMFASKFPDFPEAAEWRRRSAQIFADALRQQMLPDGLHDELSPDYHSVAYWCAMPLYETAKKNGFEQELPADYLDILRRGIEGPIALTTPAFCQPRFNDCFTMSLPGIMRGAYRYFPERKDFLWAATKGLEGEPPDGATASRFLPWSGFAAMRTDWTQSATYLCFDVGPLGVAHEHQDKLSFTLWKGDEELVFDDGGGQYEQSPERRYAISGYDHNTLLVDGLAQYRTEPKRVTAPIDARWETTARRDRAVGVYDQGFGPKQLKLATHRREIEFDKEADRFTIIDTVESADGQEHDYELLFQLPTTKTVISKDGRCLTAHYGREWDLVILVEDEAVMSAVSAQYQPRLSGWFIGRNDLTNRPATTVSVKAPHCLNHRFETKLFPIRRSRGVTSKSGYLDLMEAAVSAYDDAHLSRYLADVERDGVQEHGFPRLAANLGVLVANNRCLKRKETLKRMLDAACRDAAKGCMPPKSGGNEFSVKELVEAVVALECAKVFPQGVTDAWRKQITSINAEKCYSSAPFGVGANRAANWTVFAAASEQARIAHGMGGDPKFVEKYVVDQLRWFDGNGMYKDPNQPTVYDFVTRLQFALILSYGYNGLSRAKLEALMDRSAEPTLKMLSACGEIPYGGRSNQFLHNNTFYAALCEWYAARASREAGDKEEKRGGGGQRSLRFRQAAVEAVEAIRPWLQECPVSHVKNRYRREEGKEAFSSNADMGCEKYAYFDKYMVTMGSWAMLGWLFADDSPTERSACCCPLAVPSSATCSFVTTPDFHLVFLRAGDYSAQFDYNADTHYDCDGLGRLHRSGAPAALCLSTPCAKNPSYRIEAPNDAPLAIAPVIAATSSRSPYRLLRAVTNQTEAVADWSIDTVSNNQTINQSNNLSWSCRLSGRGLSTTLTGPGDLALTLPAFAFDGREATRIDACCRTLAVSLPAAQPCCRTLAVSYRGWKCVYETDGEIVDTGRSACNRNGRYRRFEARGQKQLKVNIRIERE